jgi:hypothetical protein
MWRGLCVLLLAPLALADIDPGQIGLEFHGNEYAFTQQIYNFPTTEFSLAFRIKAASGHIMNYGVQSGDSFLSNHFSLKAAEALVISRGGSEINTQKNFADSQWHAMAVTWKMSSGETKLYKDGKLIHTSVSSKGSPMSVDGHLMIGQIQNCPMGCFEAHTGFVGTVADLSLWARALTSNQVEYLSANSPSGDETDLVSYWPLNENDGLLGRDRTASANDFTLGGPSWATDVGLGSASTSLAMHKNAAVVLTPKNDLPTGDFTIEFWIKTSVKEDSTLLCYYDATNPDMPYPLRLHNTGLLTLNVNNEEIRLETSAATGAWNHIAVSWQQAVGRTKAYLNGRLTYPPAWLPESDYDMMPALATGATLPARPSRLIIGNLMDCTSGSCLVPGAGFDGMMQDIRVWSTVRTAEEIESWKDALLPTDPVPDGILSNWVMNHKEGETLAVDTSGRGNDASLTTAIWKNTLIAPPFPTLDEVNSKVAQLREEMTDLMDYVKDVMEPKEQKKEASFTVPEQSKCDRRYKYLCTMKTQESEEQAAPEETAETPNPSVTNVNVLVQRALHHNSLVQTELTPHAHTGETHGDARPVAGPSVLEPSQLLEVEEAAVRSPGYVSRDGDRVKTVTHAHASSVNDSPPRVRHAWATKQAMADTPQVGATHVIHPSRSSTEAPGRHEHSRVTGKAVAGVRSVTTGQQHAAPRKHRHAWAEGKSEQLTRREALVPDVAGFLEEEARVVASE